MSKIFSRQESTLQQQAKMAQELGWNTFFGFRTRNEWPGNGPNVSLMKYVLGIIQDTMDKMEPTASENTG